MNLELVTVEPASRTAAVLRIVTRVWLAFMIVGSLQPARPRIVTGAHREIHALAFAGVALLLFSGARTRREEILKAHAVFFLGLSLEVLQHLIYRNAMEWHDVRDGALAILAAFALYRLTGASARSLHRLEPAIVEHPERRDGPGRSAAVSRSLNGRFRRGISRAYRWL